MPERAASQSPTKLASRLASTIAVEDAIKAIVTRSANDIACAIGEKIGGDEETFAQMMTKKARAIGMSQTIYRNASGLPNDEQVTTARDQALLGRAIQERFPRYYRYFSTRSFTWHGHEIGNHNHLLGTVEGVDGIKTGFVHASGFNLVTSVRRNGRHLVAVVMGGSSAGSRDSRMRNDQPVHQQGQPATHGPAHRRRGARPGPCGSQNGTGSRWFDGQNRGRSVRDCIGPKRGRTFRTDCTGGSGRGTASDAAAHRSNGRDGIPACRLK